MPMTWTAELETGIPEIDTENRKIVDYVNILTDAKQSGDRSKTGEVLENLLDYVVTHFTFEEHMMEQANYEFRTSHEKIHEIFAKKLADFRGRHNNGDDVTGDALSMLTHWVESHIKQEDQRYAETVSQTIEQEGGSSWVAGVMKRLFG